MRMSHTKAIFVSSWQSIRFCFTYSRGISKLTNISGMYCRIIYAKQTFNMNSLTMMMACLSSLKVRQKWMLLLFPSRFLGCLHTPELIQLMPYLNRGRQKGKKPRTTVWGKLLICECGHTFNMRKWDRSDRAPSNAYQCYSSVRTGSYESRKKKGLPLEGICQSPMIPEWRLQMMANLIFRKYLSDKDKVLALANSILEAHIGDKEEEENVTALLNAKQEELTRLNKKLDAYIEMRSEGEISRDLFRSKCSEVEAKIEKLQEEMETLSAAAEPKAVMDYTEKLTVLQYALEQYTQCMEGVNVPDSVIEAFVTKIVVSKDSFDWYLRFDGDPDKPLRCQISGKRRQSTKIMVAGELSPAVDDGSPGSYQGYEVILQFISGNAALKNE